MLSLPPGRRTRGGGGDCGKLGSKAPEALPTPRQLRHSSTGQPRGWGLSVGDFLPEVFLWDKPAIPGSYNPRYSPPPMTGGSWRETPQSPHPSGSRTLELCILQSGPHVPNRTEPQVPTDSQGQALVPPPPCLSPPAPMGVSWVPLPNKLLEPRSWPENLLLGRPKRRDQRLLSCGRLGLDEQAGPGLQGLPASSRKPESSPCEGLGVFTAGSERYATKGHRPKRSVAVGPPWSSMAGSELSGEGGRGVGVPGRGKQWGLGWRGALVTHPGGLGGDRQRRPWSRPGSVDCLRDPSWKHLEAPAWLAGGGPATDPE